jgi:hypothetical protein
VPPCEIGNWATWTTFPLRSADSTEGARLRVPVEALESQNWSAGVVPAGVVKMTCFPGCRDQGPRRPRVYPAGRNLGKGYFGQIVEFRATGRPHRPVLH